jgi:hypothetical protein
VEANTDMVERTFDSFDSAQKNWRNQEANGSSLTFTHNYLEDTK